MVKCDKGHPVKLPVIVGAGGLKTIICWRCLAGAA